MAVAAIILARDVAEHPHLAAVERAIGNGDAQHIGVELEIEAVHQPQRLELVLGDLAGEAAVHLVAEFLDAGIDDRLVVLSYLYMSDHPAAGIGVGGFQRQVGAHRRAERADAVLDVGGAGAFGGGGRVDDIGGVDAARAFLGMGDRFALVADIGCILDMARPAARRSTRSRRRWRDRCRSAASCERLRCLRPAASLSSASAASRLRRRR
jgi:hypothetical protein